MSWHFDDKPLLAHIFDWPFQLSMDLQRVILDYLYHRQVVKFDKYLTPYWLRFGPTIIRNKIAYEIRVYNKRESYVLSTCSTKDDVLANYLLDNLKNDIIDSVYYCPMKEWTDVFFGNEQPHRRYVFSPMNHKTYRVEVFTCDYFYNIEIIIYPECRICYANRVEVPEMGKKRAIECCDLINRVGEFWNEQKKGINVQGLDK